ncbi:MAG: extracellular solute-binding protein [Planctomycetes bacterium]|nr:extracellular solute-binding protein [Planctomycetota bacterium]
MNRKLHVLTIMFIVALVVSGCGAKATPPATTKPPEVATKASVATEVPVTEPVTMDFVVWSYGLDTINDNIKNFQDLNPGITINLKDYSWLDYHDTMVGVFAANNPPYLLYGSDHWLNEWASAGWLAPLGQYCPNVAEYSTEVAPYALQGMTYNGEVYGVSYYADTQDFIYNDALLQQGGFTTAPATLDEVYTQALELKAKGVNQYPILFAWSQKEGAFPEAWTSLVFAQQEGGNALFDADLNPVFNTADSAAFKVMEWLRKVYTEGLLDPASLSMAEIDQVKSMQAGAHTFTIAPQYNMAELNKPASGDFAGKFKIALMPGPSHATVGYVRFYAMTQKVVDAGPDYIAAACKFMDYFGGKTNGDYTVVKRWAVENGLGFAQLPLFDDPTVIAAFGKWGDVPMIKQNATLARAKEGMTPWYGIWDIYARAEIQKGILGQQSSLDTLNNMAAKWVELKAAQ